jgi:hypothetical protein
MVSTPSGERTSGIAPKTSSNPVTFFFRRPCLYKKSFPELGSLPLGGKRSRSHLVLNIGGKDMAKGPKRAAIYVRVSTDKQTIENQLEALRRVAEARGWQAHRVSP